MNDRALFLGQKEIFFRVGSTAAQTMTFTVPSSTIVTAHGFFLCPFSRRLQVDTVTNGRDEIPFRPTAWAHSCRLFRNPWAKEAVDVLWELSETVGGVQRDFQNAPCSIPAMYSGTSDPYLANFEGTYPSGLTFERPLVLKGGNSFSCKITPAYTGSGTSPTDSVRNEYKLVGVLMGTKEA